MTPCASQLRTLCLALCLTTASLAAHCTVRSDALRQHVEHIDQATPGQLGVYINRLHNGETFANQAGRPWYLGQSAKLPMGPKCVDDLVRVLQIEKSALRLKTVEEAYARYYATQVNSAPLSAYGGMLERLVTGQLVSPQNLQRLFTDLKYETYDAYRLEAGLPRTVRFIHKTGTQLGRACHMGVINPQDGGKAAIVVATCAEDLDEHRDAGRAFEQIGRAITQTLLADIAKK